MLTLVYCRSYDENWMRMVAHHIAVVEYSRSRGATAMPPDESLRDIENTVAIQFVSPQIS